MHSLIIKFIISLLIATSLSAQTQDTVKIVLPKVMHCPVLGLRLRNQLKSNEIQLIDYYEKKGYLRYCSKDKKWLDETWVKTLLIEKIGIPQSEIESITISTEVQ